MLYSAARLPWMVPVPVKSSDFVPVQRCDGRFNVEVDLSRIGAFASQTAPCPPTSLAYSDLQTNADSNHHGRLGSGRSAVFDDGYVKGIGRTPLAANWNDPDALYHNSGLLLASGGIREYLVSAFLVARGRGDRICPCTGFLARPLPEALREHARNVFDRGHTRFGHAAVELPAADSRLQVLTVKGSGFSRFSNVVWWLNRLSPARASSAEIHLFFSSFYQALDGYRSAVPGDIDPVAIAEKFAETVRRTIDGWLDLWAEGVWWNSTQNNFTMDGRFLDLETPTVLPCPALGVFVVPGSDGTLPEDRVFNNVNDGIRMEVVQYAQQTRMFLKFVVARFKFFLEVAGWPSVVREFAREFVHALDRAFEAPHPLSTPESLVDAMLPRVCSALQATTSEAKMIESMLYGSARALSPSAKLARRRKVLPVTLRRFELPDLANREPTLPNVGFAPEFVLERMRLQPRVLNIEFNLAVKRAETIEGVGELLSFLRTTRQAWIDSAEGGAGVSR